MKTLFLMNMVFFFMATAGAVTIESVQEEIKDVTLREDICRDVYFDFYDYGEFFEEEDSFSNYCATTSIRITQKISDKFPEGKTPEGFADVITTKMDFQFKAENESCTGSLVRNLPNHSFQVNSDGAIEEVKSTIDGWMIIIEDCEDI